jgi:hypothetical protein
MRFWQDGIMADAPGYPLPAGDAFTEDLACSLIFWPDKPEYRRALRASLHYLGTWGAWERDEARRGRDAAAAWKEANELTEGCLEMNLCDQMITLLTEIRDAQRACSCAVGNYVTYNENLTVSTIILPGVGQPPATWGDQAISTWDDWSNYVCGAGHLYVDDLKDTADKLKAVALVGGLTIDFVAHLFSIVQWRMVEQIIPVDFSLIQTILNGLGEGLINLDVEAIKADIEAHRENIVCALLLGDDLATVVEGALDSSPIWDLFFQFLDYESTTAAIYRGEVDGYGYLTPDWRTDCLCGSLYDCGDTPLNDCSFESQGLNEGWELSAQGIMPIWVQDATDGVVSLVLDGGTGGSGYPQRYVYQDFTVDTSGNYDFRFDNKRYQGVYSTYFALYYWNGSAWIQQGSNMACDLDNNWSQSHYILSLTAGTQYQLRISGGAYHNIDNISLLAQ